MKYYMSVPHNKSYERNNRVVEKACYEAWAWHSIHGRQYQ